MIINSNSLTPIYIQIADWLENEILNSNILVDEKIHSQYQLAEMFNINPATAAKGLNILAENRVLYKKRGLGMFVSSGAREIIMAKRKNEKLHAMIKELAIEALQLNVDEEELLSLIRERHRELKGDVI